MQAWSRRSWAIVFAAMTWGVAGCSKDVPEPAPKAESPAVSKPAEAPKAQTSAAPAVSSAVANVAVASPKGILRKLIWAEGCDEERAYVDCVSKSCAGAYRECYGDKVDDGQMAGPCKEYGECTVACLADPDEIGRAACGLDCADRHKKDKDACDTCSGKIDGCVTKAGCKLPTGCK